MMVVYGKNVVEELLYSNVKITSAFVMKGFSDDNLLDKLNRVCSNIKILERSELDKMEKGNHQGIIVKIPDYEYCDIDDCITDNPFLLILDHIEDPHNLGAIIRTSEAAGVDAIIIPKNRSVEVNSTVMKTSAGALNNMKICLVNNISNTMNYLKKKGIWIIGTDMDGSDYSSIDYSMPLAIVIGNEGKGLGTLVKQNCDFIASIPMKGKINSLNASVASALMIYKVVDGRTNGKI